MIFRLSQRIVVMRDGRLMADRPAGELDRFTLEALMVGRELARISRDRDASAGDRASVRDLGNGARVEGSFRRR